MRRGRPDRGPKTSPPGAGTTVGVSTLQEGSGVMGAPVVVSAVGRPGEVIALPAGCRRNAFETAMVDPAVVGGENAFVRFAGQDARSSAAFRAAGNRWAGVTY